MKQETEHSEERILASIPFKPFSVLTVTNQRLIGKRYISISPSRFDGEILINHIRELIYTSGTPYIATPSLTIIFEQGEKLSQVKIRFPGIMARFTGYNPEEIYKLILSQIR